jgi:hypothetical protein
VAAAAEEHSGRMPTRDLDQVRYVGAVIGDRGWELEQNQKMVIPFVYEEGGPDLIYNLDVPGVSLGQIRTDLDRFGIKNRTLEPQAGGARIHVFDPGSKLREAMEKVGGHYGAKVDTYKGRGEFLGGDTRAEGHQAYERVIREYEARHPEQAYKLAGGQNQGAPRQ